MKWRFYNRNKGINIKDCRNYQNDDEILEITKKKNVAKFGRDLILISGWLIIYFSTGMSTVIPTIVGKTAAVLQMTVVCLVLLSKSGYLTEGKWLTVKPFILSVMILFTVISGMEYCLRGIRMISKETA